MNSLAQMTKEQKLLYWDILQEKKRRILAKKPVYKPNGTQYEGQLAVHLDPKKIRIVAAGNGGGKTALAVQECIWWSTGYNPITEQFSKVPSTVIVLLDSPIKVDQVWLPELRKWYPLDSECELNKKGKPYVNQITFKNGSQIIFMFHEQEDLVFEGIQLDYLITDEPFPRRIWLALTRGQRKKGSEPRVLIIGTPLGQPWIYNDLWKASINGERDDIGLHRFETRVNEANLADGYIETFAKNLTDQEKKVRLGGHFAHLEGLALAHLFDRSVHLVNPFPWPKGKPAVLIVDPHFSKPHSVLLMGATGDGRIYCIKEFESKSPARRFAAELREFIKGDWRIVDYVIDSLGETPNTGGEGNTSFAEVLRLSGLPFRATNFDDKDDESFIQNIQQVLEIPEQKDNFGRQIPKLAIFRGCCEKLVDNIETVQWQKYRQHDVFKPKLDIASKDLLACLKYGLKTNIGLIAEVGRMPRIKRPGRSPWSGRR
jgi:hypothetical protein